MQIIRRECISALYDVVIDGQHHPLGIVKAFSSNDALADFFAGEGPVSMSWVSLSRRQELSPHRHDEKSLILITSGRGQLLGDHVGELEEGDAVLVGSGELHGFRSIGAGFWGLSVQFAPTPLYGDQERPRVAFETPRPLQVLLERDAQHRAGFARSRLMRLLDTAFIDQPSVREVLLGNLQRWSDAFQQLLHVRVAHTVSPLDLRIARDHLVDELGHNEQLRAQRADLADAPWDPGMESAIAWFRDAMAKGDDADRAILMHLVLEGSGEIFHERAAIEFSDMPHFELHGEEDGEHGAAGHALIDAVAPQDLGCKLEWLDRCWGMLTFLCDRMSELSESQATRRLAALA